MEEALVKHSYERGSVGRRLRGLAAGLNLSRTTPRFHLVGHDHGAMLGWTCAASARGASIQSYTALSIPHPVAFSSGLWGAHADLAQQVASQYFTMFVLNRSASLHADFWYLSLGLTAGKSAGPNGTTWARFGSATAFQKALWWYNGAQAAGVLAMPPAMTPSELAKTSLSIAALRELYGGAPDNGTAASHPVRPVAVPSLFVCGDSDPTVLCDHAFALGTRDLVVAPYSYLKVDCGHDLLSCSNSSSTAQVVGAVLAFIARQNQNHSGASRRRTAGTEDLVEHEP